MLCQNGDEGTHPFSKQFLDYYSQTKAEAEQLGGFFTAVPLLLVQATLTQWNIPAVIEANGRVTKRHRAFRQESFSPSRDAPEHDDEHSELQVQEQSIEQEQPAPGMSGQREDRGTEELRSSERLLPQSQSARLLSALGSTYEDDNDGDHEDKAG